jgi:hypothetical protein
MFTRTPALDRPSPSLRWCGAGLAGLALLVLGVGTACEDKGIGRPCDITFDASPNQGAYTHKASECPSQLCVKPAIQPGVINTLDTGAYCTSQCSSDTDCKGQERDPGNPLDTRCRKGYTCAPVFDKGPLCCEKLCLCRDFFSSSVGPAIPEACRPDAGVTCS